MKKVNIIGESPIDAMGSKKLLDHVESGVVYSDDSGTVFMSRSRKKNMPNIWLSSAYSEREFSPEDSFWMAEPVVVNPGDYDISFLSKFNKVFGCFEKFAKNTIIKDNFIKVAYGIESGYRDPDELIKNWIPITQRHQGVLVVASGNKYSTHPSSIYNCRIALSDFLYDNGFDVSWYGRTKIDRPYYKGFLQDDGRFDFRYKINEICKYKFHICTENTYDIIYSNNYMTEKLPHAIYGGSIPLYIGCYNIEEIVPSDVFFDLRKFISTNGKAVISKHILEVLNNVDHAQYNHAQTQCLKDKNGMFRNTDLGRVYKCMLEALG